MQLDQITRQLVDHLRLDIIGWRCTDLIDADARRFLG